MTFTVHSYTTREGRLCAVVESQDHRNGLTYSVERGDPQLYHWSEKLQTWYPVAQNARYGRVENAHRLRRLVREYLNTL